MPRTLILSLDGKEFPVKIVKVDREKLYGVAEIEAFDEAGNECTMRVLASDGKTLIDRGGTALATLSEDGEWIDRRSLVAVDGEGEEIEPVPSSFNATNILHSTSVEEYLSHIVKSVYFIESSDESDLNLGAHISADSIYKFPFSYRGGLEYDNAFLLTNRDGVFMIVGTEARMQFLKLSQETILDSVEEQEISEDELDFGLL